MVTRIIPYPPSFRRRAARSIDPAIGASTWALGSHRCSPYNGAFTMKARRRARLDARLVHEEFIVGCESFSRGKYSVPNWLCRCRMVIKRGSELASV